MKQTMQLQISSPCHENWAGMMAAAQGRFCLSCQKQVVDFNLMTDTEILQYLATAGSICARIRNDQLNRNLIAKAEPRQRWWKYWISVAASFVLLTAKSYAQVKIQGDTIINQSRPVSRIACVVGKIRSPEVAEKSIELSGVITDQQNNPVMDAAIIIKNTSKGTLTDNRGIFHLGVDYPENLILHISAIGYEMQEIKITRPDMLNNSVNIKLQLILKPITMGEVVIVGKRKNKFFKYFQKDSAKNASAPVVSSVTVFPNPVIKGAAIKINMHNVPDGNYKVFIADVAGNVVSEKEINVQGKSAEAFIKSDARFASGTYILNMISNNKSFSSPFIVL